MTADDLLFAAVDAILDDLKTPARQYLSSAAAVADGPVKTTRFAAGECLTPGSGAAAGTAVTESAGSVVDPMQAQTPATQGRNRAGEPPLPGAGTFSLPRAKPFEIGVSPLYDVLPARQS